ncbi:PREDICTED: wound-induced protein 1 [Nicotiana attenuata]|uniref:Wound-induced protein 1 n=1 Tax=Nicotiana attenuata TaxID=49451 RepID=A0A1J6JX06_NICAT|nr:PREDICTED: wound-induced protein 1 [Nicotiana attenuata]OIT22290.1 wound-induced protein 1 [Nicotiana attenuata]
MAPSISIDSNTNINSETENKNKAIVKTLYKAFACTCGDSTKKVLESNICSYIADDLEWWFHGPQNCHYMMKMLTGELSNQNCFKFEPRSVDAIDDDRVIVEGWEGAKAYWVHVWTLKDGVITQFREYFNTWLTVTELRPTGWVRSSTTLWQSHPRDLAKRSLPGLMLAI